MSLRLKTKEERREARLMFYKDDVFVIAHKALQQIPCSLSVEEVFYVAEKFAHFLMEYDISCTELRKTWMTPMPCSRYSSLLLSSYVPSGKHILRL